jgi:uncharacterized membrane protein YeaQ/YmgE (transglycosylase-associated protein family)
MSILILIVAMVLVGLLMGYIGGLIWKDHQPIGAQNDFLAATITAVAIGLLDWFVIPAMGFSATMRLLGVIFEPALGALLVLWVIRKARS